MAGGVCAVLDYDVDLMADYVSEMATRIVTPQNPVESGFRKFILGILTSTRLPSTTILLGMNYLAKRINMMAAAGKTSHAVSEIWGFVTTALLLGSKFLDDNTFQNKSWSDVSGIPVKELNTMETEWLSNITWGLFVNLDESQDFKAWLSNWQEWLDNKKRQQAQATRERLASLVSPIDTNVGHTRNAHTLTWHQRQVAEYERLSSMKRNPAPPSYRRDQPAWAYSVAWPQSAPLTPPDSGYGTPEYSNSAVNAQYAEYFDRALIDTTNAASRHYQAPVYNAFHHGHSSRNQAQYPGFYNYGHSIWDNGSGADSGNCGTCNPHNPPSYFASHAYGQPVVG